MSKANETYVDDSLEKYLQLIQNTKPLTLEQEIELGKRIEQGDEDAIKELVTANLRFVVNMAKNSRKRGVPFIDLISEGNYWMTKAAKTYDWRKGFKFISYAVWYIKRGFQGCAADFGYSDNVLWIDCIDDEKLINIGNCGETILTHIEDRLLSNNSYSQVVQDMIKGLQDREKQVLSLYFGLKDGKSRTLKEIGKEMALTQERVRQIKDMALVKLRGIAMMSDNFDEIQELATT